MRITSIISLDIDAIEDNNKTSNVTFAELLFQMDFHVCRVISEEMLTVQ
jgi:hypothetical protein